MRVPQTTDVCAQHRLVCLYMGTTYMVHAIFQLSALRVFVFAMSEEHIQYVTAQIEEQITGNKCVCLVHSMIAILLARYQFHVTTPLGFSSYRSFVQAFSSIVCYFDHMMYQRTFARSMRVRTCARRHTYIISVAIVVRLAGWLAGWLA